MNQGCLATRDPDRPRGHRAVQAVRDESDHRRRRWAAVDRVDEGAEQTTHLTRERAIGATRRGGLHDRERSRCRGVAQMHGPARAARAFRLAQPQREAQPRVLVNKVDAALRSVSVRGRGRQIEFALEGERGAICRARLKAEHFLAGGAARDHSDREGC